MTLNETINHYLELAKINEMKAKLDAVETEIVGTYSKYTNGDANKYMSIQEQYLERAREFRQLAEWLRELNAYRGLSTYNRPCKCYDCDYEDSEYYCDDCIWQFVDKFKPKEVEGDVRLTNN